MLSLIFFHKRRRKMRRSAKLRGVWPGWRYLGRPLRKVSDSSTWGNTSGWGGGSKPDLSKVHDDGLGLGLASLLLVHLDILLQFLNRGNLPRCPEGRPKGNPTHHLVMVLRHLFFSLLWSKDLGKGRSRKSGLRSGLRQWPMNSEKSRVRPVVA